MTEFNPDCIKKVHQIMNSKKIPESAVNLELESNIRIFKEMGLLPQDFVAKDDIEIF